MDTGILQDLANYSNSSDEMSITLNEDSTLFHPQGKRLFSINLQSESDSDYGEATTSHRPQRQRQLPAWFCSDSDND